MMVAYSFPTQTRDFGELPSGSNVDRVSMFGVDGFCPSCRVGNRPQAGPFVLKASSISQASGVWLTFALAGSLLMDEEARLELRSRGFDIEPRRVELRPSRDRTIWQLDPMTIVSGGINLVEFGQIAERWGHSPERCDSCGSDYVAMANIGALRGVSLPPGTSDLMVAFDVFTGLIHAKYRPFVLREDFAMAIEEISPRNFRPEPALLLEYPAVQSSRPVAEIPEWHIHFAETPSRARKIRDRYTVNQWPTPAEQELLAQAQTQREGVLGLEHQRSEGRGVG